VFRRHRAITPGTRAAILVLPLRLHKDGHFGLARAALRGPEIQNDELPTVVDKPHLLPTQVRKRKLRLGVFLRSGRRHESRGRVWLLLCDPMPAETV